MQANKLVFRKCKRVNLFLENASSLVYYKNFNFLKNTFYVKSDAGVSVISSTQT